MTSTTHTGGLKKFVYPKGHQPRKLTYQEEIRIDEAYEKARKRKLKNKIIKYSILGLIILAIVLYFIFS